MTEIKDWAEVTGSSLPVLVDFYSTRCVPCQMVSPILQKLSKEFDGRVLFVKVNTTIEPGEAIASNSRVSAVPAVLLFKNGIEIRRFIGVRPESAYLQALQEVTSQS